MDLIDLDGRLLGVISGVILVAPIVTSVVCLQDEDVDRASRRHEDTDPVTIQEKITSAPRRARLSR